MGVFFGKQEKGLSPYTGQPFLRAKFLIRLLLFDDFTLAGQVFFKAKFLAVEDAVCEVADPVSQADHPAVFGDTDIIGDMTVSEYEIFNVRVLFQFLSGKLELVFIFNPHKRA